MGFDRKKIKEESKRFIKADVKIIFIMGAIITIASGMVPFVKFPFFISIILFALATLPRFGFYKYVFKRENNQHGSLEDLTSGFNWVLKIVGLNLIILALTTIGYMFFVIPGVILSLMFSMSNIILAENPNKSITECLKESRDITYGVKGDLFIFYLSFILWIIFSEILFFIPFCLVNPYILTAEVKIYRNLKKQAQNGDIFEEKENFTLL